MQKNAKLYRNALRGLVAALALGGLQVAHAGYAQLAAPAGYATTSGGHTYAAAANDRIYGRVVHQAGALTANVGGQAVKMPAAYRLAANAPRIAAAAIFANPYVRVGVGIATWLGISGLIWDESEKIWRRQVDNGEYIVKEYRWDQSYPWTTSHTAACQTIVQFYNNLDAGGDYSNSIKSCGADGQVTRNRRWKGEAPGSDFRHSLEVRELPTMQCPVNWTATPAGCLSPGLTQPEMVELLNPANQPGWPMPDSVPKELPLGTPLPVEQPFINPEPGENPSNRPQRVPTGQPVPIPNTDPQQWRQPYVDIVPAPTPESPWRVDIKPGDTTSTDPNPVKNPQPDAEDKPTPEEDKSLCEKHPDILACQNPELDVPDGEIPKATKQITYAEEGGFGGGSCPGNIYSNVGGKSIMVYNWSETCGVVSTYLRPIILLLGAMGALFILIPGRDS